MITYIDVYHDIFVSRSVLLGWSAKAIAILEPMS